jgi:predicted GIY-YIG superfamily endonuclease
MTFVHYSLNVSEARQRRRSRSVLEGHLENRRSLQTFTYEHFPGGNEQMSFSECGARSFTAVSVRKNAPESSGVYGLSNRREWLFIGEASNIQARLLEHLEETGTLLMNRGPTGFTFEECLPSNRIDRQNALIRELEPFCNRRLDHFNRPAHRRAY